VNTSQVISNAGPLIALAKVNQLHLLAKLYGTVLVPASVYDEVVTQGLARGDLDALVARLFLDQHQWPVINVDAAEFTRLNSEVVLHAGETAVIVLGLSSQGCLLLLDDTVARGEAQRLGLRVKGTLGVLVEAYRHQHISRPQLELVMQEIAARPDIWISAQLCTRVLTTLFP
jgi:predicted nucleic acid-binding protein